MKPISFSEQNTVFTASGCDDLPALKIHNEQFDCDEIVSCWELSEEDLRELNRQAEDGKRPAIYLSVIGGQPPVSLYVKEDV